MRCEAALMANVLRRNSISGSLPRKLHHKHHPPFSNRWHFPFRACAGEVHGEKGIPVKNSPGQYVYMCRTVIYYTAQIFLFVIVLRQP